MLRTALRARVLAAGGLLLAALVAAGAGWWFWRQKQDRTVLFRRLPAENVLLVYLDVERLRRAPALEPLLRSRVEPDPDYAGFVKQTGFDYQRDLDAAAVCFLSDRVYILARGRFDPARLRQYALGQGGSCSGAALDRPCHMPASRLDRKISFFMLSPGLLGMATAPEADAVLQLRTPAVSNAEPLAQGAAAMNDGPTLLWATATPTSLDSALSGGSAVPANLALFSRALAKAQRAYLFVTDRSPDLEVSLRAVCNSDSQAGELRRLLQGLNDFIGGLMRGARGHGPAGEWEKVLASASIDQQRNTVRAAWTFDQTVLQALEAPETEQRPR